MVVDVAVIALFAMLGVLVVVEVKRPARVFPAVPGWRLKCVAFMAAVIGVSTAIPFAWRR